MPSNIVIDIKIKPHLREYLYAKYGYPVLASHKNIVGIFIKPLLERPPVDYIFTKIDPDDVNFVKIKLPHYDGYTENGLNYISEYNQRLFVKMIYLIFKEQLHSYIDERIKLGFTKKDSILQFCDNHNISFNYINYEMLKKSHDRYSKIYNKNMNENISKLSPTMSLTKNYNYILIFDIIY